LEFDAAGLVDATGVSPNVLVAVLQCLTTEIIDLLEALCSPDPFYFRTCSTVVNGRAHILVGQLMVLSVPLGIIRLYLNLQVGLILVTLSILPSQNTSVVELDFGHLAAAGRRVGKTRQGTMGRSIPQNISRNQICRAHLTFLSPGSSFRGPDSTRNQVHLFCVSLLLTHTPQTTPVEHGWRVLGSRNSLRDGLERSYA
jgi:hypothetical protein